MDKSLLAVLIGGILGILGSMITIILATRLDSRRRQAIEARRESLTKAHSQISGMLSPTTTSNAAIKHSEPSPEIIKSIENQIVARIAANTTLSNEEVREELERELREIQQRVHKIEDRFPEDAKLEKIASINDALLSERIDQLAGQISALEKRILTHWDVAKIVSTIVGSICAVVVATYGIIQFLTKSP